MRSDQWNRGSVRLRSLAVLAAMALAVPAMAGTGGGYAGAGLDGAYFANPDLKGAAGIYRNYQQLVGSA